MSISLQTKLRTTTAVLVVATLALAILVLRQIAQTSPDDTTPGEVVPLSQPVYGPATPMRVPGRDVAFRVGHPVEQLDHSLVATSYDDPSDPDLLVAPEGGRLVPITWQIYPTRILGAELEQPHMTVRLISGEQAITLWTPKSGGGLDPTRSFAVAVAGQPDLGDLTLEVETDGVVQRLDPATGEIDAGAAQGLYDSRTFATSCEDLRMGCSLSAASPDQPLLPSDFSVTAGKLSTYAYDSKLGWAPDGQVWAATRVQVIGGDAYDSSGTNYFVPRQRSARAELIGSDGEVIDSTLAGLTDDNAFGWVVFAIPTDFEPTELVLSTRAAVSHSQQQMPLRARIQLH